MISATGIVVAVDSFGPIVDNAAGIAAMSGAPESVRNVIDDLDIVGNTAKAITKGYAIASAGLVALVLFSGYVNELAKFSKGIIFDFQNPLVLSGLILGAVLPYFFSSMAMKAVGKAAGLVVEEIRRQFKEIPGIMEFKNKPDYGKVVDIATKASLKKMVLPAIVPVLLVLFIGFFMGAQALGGFLIGSIISGVLMAFSMIFSGAAWDNAKKLIEAASQSSEFSGKGSETHKAAVIGDTVGDPYKDVAGPAINPLIKVVSILALLIAPFL